MVRITKDEDLLGQRVDGYALPFLYDHLHGLQDVLSVEDLEDCGPIWLIEQPSDWAEYERIGLSEPFEDTPVEWIRRIQIMGGDQTRTLYCACVLMNNDYAVSIVFGDDVVEHHMRNTLNDLLEGVITEYMSLDEFMASGASPAEEAE
ncbi:MAG: hypothetical protein ACI4XW_02455 [Candidatus Spyradocola sp.]